MTNYHHNLLIKLKTDVIVVKSLLDSIATLKIPAGTECVIASTKSGKCRAEKAEVLMLENKRLSPTNPVLKTDTAAKHYWRYQLFKEVRPDKFNKNLNTKCAAGIHFFRTNAPKSSAQDHYSKYDSTLDKNTWGTYFPEYVKNYCKVVDGFYVPKDFKGKTAYKIIKNGDKCCWD